MGGQLVKPPSLLERAAASNAIAAVRRADIAAAIKAYLDPSALAVVYVTG